MVAAIDYLKSHRFIGAVGLSILFHLIFLLFYAKWEEIRLFPLPREAKQIAFEIVENPNAEYLKNRPKQADLYSDRNAIAKDQMDLQKPDTRLPYSNGISQVKDVKTQKFSIDNQTNQQNPMQNSQHRTEPEPLDRSADMDHRIQSSSSFSREQLLIRSKSRTQHSQELAYRQTLSSADHSGGISFNTYDWDFAPYLLELKKRIERNIYPPPAFTHLGIGGSNLIRFRIARNGEMNGPEVLGYEGEKALIETSKKAIEVSAPFWPLPDDFPRDYLEVTARFYYVIDESS